MSEQWRQDDPRLRPLPLSQYDFRPIPASSSADAKWEVSVLDTSSLRVRRALVCSIADPVEVTVVPVFSFLLERGDRAILFDLGLRQDPDSFPP